MPNTPLLPPGAVSVTADELARVLAAGDHPEIRAGDLLDSQLVEAVRADQLLDELEQSR